MCDESVESLLEKAERLLKARQLAEARRAYLLALPAGADPAQCSAGRWMIAMLFGDFASAWRENDLVRAAELPDPHRMWDGGDLAGKRVIVRCLHGFGDAVQMLRFAPRLAKIAAEVTYQMAPGLLPIARCFTGVEHAVTWDEAASQQSPEWDAQVEIMELPYLFRIEAADLPLAQKYFNVPAVEMERVKASLGVRTRPRVGVVWAAGEWNPQRSVTLHDLEGILSLEAVELWNLQGKQHADDARGTRMRNGGAICGDGTLALAATIAGMDLVITVDTLAAHLAGAMGKEVWVMLECAADWRWMDGREDSPWYPTMRLFRQQQQGDWSGVVDEITMALTQRWRKDD